MERRGKVCGALIWQERGNQVCSAGIIPGVAPTLGGADHGITTEHTHAHVRVHLSGVRNAL